MLLLAIYLILVGLSALIALPIGGPIMSVLALLAGILILAGRWGLGASMTPVYVTTFDTVVGSRRT